MTPTSAAVSLLLLVLLYVSSTDGFIHRQRRNITNPVECVGIHGTKKHLEIWISGEWQFQCNDGRTKVIGCIATPRGNTQTISVNSSVTVNGFWHNCTETGNTVKYLEESSCIANGKEVHVNETFQQGNFKMRCKESGYDIAGCYYNSSDGSTKDIPVGTTNFTDGRFEYSCTNDGSGGVRYYMTPTGCEQDGKYYKKGESWKNQNFKFICGDQGSYKITHCWASETNLEIEVGKTETKNGVIHQCNRVGNVVFYHTSSGSGCNPATDPSCTQPATTANPSSGSNTLGGGGGGQQQLVVLTGSSRWTSNSPSTGGNSFGSSGSSGSFGPVSFPIGSSQNERIIQPSTGR